jgi:hypothetical protein
VGILNADAGAECNADAGSMPVDEMMHVVETDQADEDEIDGDDVVEQPRHDQNQDAGDDGDKRRDMGSGDDHDFPSSFWEDRMVSNAMAG